MVSKTATLRSNNHLDSRAPYSHAGVSRSFPNRRRRSCIPLSAEAALVYTLFQTEGNPWEVYP
jgi:hypothetical protein